MVYLEQPAFLPSTPDEMKSLGWDLLDILLITGDAYVDHPSFGAALLGRWLLAHGFRVGIIAQPLWDTLDDIVRLGRPKLFAGVTAGALDSMLAHYTAFRKPRSDDAYTPGGKKGARPNRACIVYTNLIKAAFPRLPVVLGGLEASLRRISHYDFWSDKLRRSILLDSKADLIVYGMAEKSILVVADLYRRLNDSPVMNVAEMFSQIPGIVFTGQETEIPLEKNIVHLPSHEAIQADLQKLMDATCLVEEQMVGGGVYAVQRVGSRTVVLTPPNTPLSTQEMDKLYALPFSRVPHPIYDKPIPGYEMIKHSLVSHRGCGGGCSFCSLSLHQGRRIQSRSRHSIWIEAEKLTQQRNWDGTISDVGGPSANMWGAQCTKGSIVCKRKSCLFPSPCPNFKASLKDYVDLLKSLKRIPGVRHVHVASGLRYDLAMQDPASLAGFICDFVGGHLKAAPEHKSKPVLRLMRKPNFSVFQMFQECFRHASEKADKEQFIIPYFMSAFPGCTDRDMKQLAEWLKSQSWKPQQVQCFIPTPGTVATAMYYAGIDTRGNPIAVARTDDQRRRQHNMIIPQEKAAFKRKTRRRGRSDLAVIARIPRRRTTK